MILIIFLTIKKLNKYVHKIFGILFVRRIWKKSYLREQTKCLGRRKNRGERMKLLLIDNDSTHARVLQDVFALWGHDVELCLSSEDLSHKLQKGDWHGVLTELSIPGMEKYEVITRVKEELPWVPIFVLTDSGSVKSAVRAIQSGADEFFIKPADVNQLKMLLLQIHRNLDQWNQADYLRHRLQKTSIEMQLQIQQVLHFMRQTRNDFNRLRSIQHFSLENISEGILLLNGEGIVQLVNRKMLHYLGIKDSENIYEENLFAVKPELKKSDLAMVYESVLRQKKNVKFQNFRLKEQDKKTKPVELAAGYLRFPLMMNYFTGVLFILNEEGQA